MKYLFSITFAALFILAGSAGQSPAETTIGGEFLINTTTTGAQIRPAVASDSLGNFVVVWQSDVAGNQDIVARLYDGAGSPLGAEFPIASTVNDETRPAVAMLPGGGFVAAWEWNNQVWLRRYSAVGTPLGIAQQLDARAGSTEMFPAIDVASDGEFVIVVDAGAEIYVQRYTSTATMIGTAFQANITTASSQVNPDVAIRADKIFIVTWTSLDQDGDHYGVFCRRFDWTGGGTAETQVNTYTTGAQNYSRIGVQSTGGYIIAWTSDGQDGSLDGVYAQRFSSTDVKLGLEFRVNDYTVSTQSLPNIAVNASDEFTIAWYSSGQDGSSFGVYAQDYTATGTLSGLGYRVNTNVTGVQVSPVVAVGGLHQIIVWYGDGADPDGYGVQGQRFGAPPSAPDLVVSSLVSPADITDASVAFTCSVTVVNQGAASGPFLVSLELSDDNVITAGDVTLDSFTVTGLASAADTTAVLTVSLPSGTPRGQIFVGAIADANNDIAEINETNNTAANPLGFHVPDIYSLEDVEGDQGGNLYLKWYSSPLDTVPDGTIGEYTVWRAIDIYSASRLVETGAITMDEYEARSIENAAVASSPATAGGVIRSARMGSRMIFWELIGTQPAYFKPGYAMAVPTLFDSTAVNTDYHYVQVIAHIAAAPYPYYVSAIDSARSTDDLAPAAPLNLAGVQSGADGIDITWDPNTEADFASYSVHRGTSAGFAPTHENRIGVPDAPGHHDPDWQWDSGYFYKIAAVDIHGNASEYSDLTPGTVTGTSNDTPARVTALEQNRPNPFNPATTIRYSLAGTARVNITVFDTAGRRVRQLVDETKRPGVYSAVWDGRNDGGRQAATGVYFYRMKTGDYTQTLKMVLIK